MSKERLEEIETRLNTIRDRLNYGYEFINGDTESQLYKDIFWMMRTAREQAERVQELEEELNKQLETGYKIECHLYESNKQNKRYQEAIVRARALLTNIGNNTSSKMSTISILTKALEDEE